MRPRVLITGASGFIGSYLVLEALRRGWETYAAVRTTSSRAYLQQPGIRFFLMDMGDTRALRNDLKAHRDRFGSFDFVMHNAGITKPKSPGEFERGNARFTAEFARMLLETHPEIQRFVFMSSLGAIGPGDPLTLQAIAEDQEPRPLTPYAKSKLLGERMLQEMEDLPHVVLRPAAVYGARDVKFIHRIIGMLNKGVEVRLGPRRQALSFIHASDLAWVTAEACVAPVAGHAFNLSDGMAYDQVEFNAIVKEVLGRNATALRIPTTALTAIGFTSLYINKILGRPVHLSHHKMREITARNWNADITKARKLLGFEPQYMLREGIADAVAWYQKRQ